MRSVRAARSVPMLVLPLDIPELLVDRPCAELLLMPEPPVVPVPFMRVVLEPELLMPLEVVEPVVDGEPLAGCERSPCDKPELGGDMVLLDEPLVPMEEPVVPEEPIDEPPVVEPDCWTGVPSLRELSLPVTGAVVRGAGTEAEGVVPLPAAVEPVVPEVPVVPIVPVVPVMPCCDCVGFPSLRALSLAVTGAVVLGLVVVADGVVGAGWAIARPIEPNRAAAAAAVFRRLNAFIVCTPGG